MQFSILHVPELLKNYCNISERQVAVVDPSTQISEKEFRNNGTMGDDESMVLSSGSSYQLSEEGMYFFLVTLHYKCDGDYFVNV